MLKANTIDTLVKKKKMGLRTSSKIPKHLNDIYISVLLTYMAAPAKWNLL